MNFKQSLLVATAVFLFLLLLLKLHSTQISFDGKRYEFLGMIQTTIQGTVLSVPVYKEIK